MRINQMVHVVEDDAMMRDSLLLLLKSAGLQARGYASAEEFLAAWNSADAPCLLADVRLPGMDGLALLKHLVSLRAEPAVVMITGHGDIPMAVAALKAGAADFLSKPFDPVALLASVRFALNRAHECVDRRSVVEEVRSRIKTLTPHEVGVLALLIEGAPTKIIAAR